MGRVNEVRRRTRHKLRRLRGDAASEVNTGHVLPVLDDLPTAPTANAGARARLKRMLHVAVAPARTVTGEAKLQPAVELAGTSSSDTRDP